MNMKARNWNIRLYEEIKTNTNGKFVTLTFNNESLNKFRKELNTVDDNKIATRAVYLYNNRYRKKYKKALRHWLITEKGHQNTERIHLHGIIFTDNIHEIESMWSYGWVYIGNYCNEQTINYIIKYVTKIDTVHPDFKGKILCSPGIGRTYIQDNKALNNIYKEKDTNDNYVTKNGKKLPLPIYYKNKLYTEKERNQLWSNKLDQEKRYVLGVEIDTSTPKGMEKYYKLLHSARIKNAKLGYKSIDWNKTTYEDFRKIINDITKNIKNNSISSLCLTNNSNNDNNYHNSDFNRIRDLGSNNKSDSIDKGLDSSREYIERLTIPF